MIELVPLVGLAAGTMVSEDATCLLAGAAAAGGHISLATAIAGCGFGIFIGDCALWMVGRVAGARVLRWRWSDENLHVWTQRLERHAAAVIVGSRFVPGTRLALYLAAGALGTPARTFLLWTFVAVALWTPLLVVWSALVGHAIGVVLTFAALYALRQIGLRGLPRRIAARPDRWRRWEFWPGAVIYAPVVAWIGWLAVRHGGIGTIAAANPAIPEGGFVGESKVDILRQLPASWTVPAAHVPSGDLESRVRRIEAAMRCHSWSFPLIVKPDAGQRGAGVRRVRSIDEVRSYLAAQLGSVLAQPYHPGPFEAGIFYYRLPSEAAGRIFSITDKRFPVVIGDGRSTLEDLIWRHPRYRLQARVFLALRVL